MIRMKTFAILCIALTYSSCVKWPTEHSAETDLSEDRGTLVTSSIPTSWLTLIWSKNSDEIITASSSGILAVNVSNHTIRSIETADCVNYIQLSEDGNRIYYLLGEGISGGSEPLYRISLDGKDHQLLLQDLWTAPFSLSPDSLIANSGSSGNPIYIYDEHSKSNDFLVDGYPITFSPDGKQLLYDANSSWYICAIESRSIQRISFPKDILS